MAMLAVLVPCFTGSGCQLSWDAIGAMGSWFAAIGTFVAAAAALYVSGQSMRQVRADRVAESRLNYMSMWPMLHRAQALVATLARDLTSDSVPDKWDQKNIGDTVQALEAVLSDIATISSRLDGPIADRVTGAVALAGYVARQMRRVAWPSHPGLLTGFWGDIRHMGWLDDARLATGLLLELATETQDMVAEVTGRNSKPSRRDDAYLTRR